MCSSAFLTPFTCDRYILCLVQVRGYESYQLLAASITFATHMDTLLSLVRDRLPSASAPSVRNKISSLLQYAARGVHANPTARPVPLAIWVHGALQVCVCVCGCQDRTGQQREL